MRYFLSKYNLTFQGVEVLLKKIKYRKFAKQISYESTLVKTSSQEVLREFDALGNNFV